MAAGGDTIVLNGLEFYAYHGAGDAEQSVGHRYLVDARLTLDLRPAGASDDLSRTVNYAEAAQLLVEVGTGTQFRLLETLSERMAGALFARFPTVESVWLRVQKVAPPMNAIVASVGVEIARDRADTELPG